MLASAFSAVHSNPNQKMATLKAIGLLIALAGNGIVVMFLCPQII